VKRAVTCLLALSLALMAIPALAQDKGGSPLNVTTVEAFAYKQLPVFTLGGVQEILTIPGKVLVMIQVTALPQFSGSQRRVRISYRDIVAVTPQGQAIKMIGYFQRYGQFSVGTRNLYAYRFSGRVKPVVYNAVFPVPAGVTELTLKLGAVSAKVKIPAKTSETPDPASAVTIKLVGARMVPQIKLARRVSGGLAPTVVTNPNGSLLEVTFTLTPLRPNGTNPKYFFWYSRWIGLYDAAGTYISPVGERFMGKLTMNVSHNLSRGAAGWRSTTATFYFAVPKNFGKFKLAYCNRIMAEGQVK
jgi:hypothetical protein